MNRSTTLAVCSLGLAAAGLSATRLPDRGAFDSLTLTLEVNATDGNSEVILDAETGLPLERLALIAPDGRVVQRIDASSPGGVGLSELRLESGEPGLEELLAAYPAGSYVVRARALDGTLLTGVVELAHDLPARWRLEAPERVAPGEALVVSFSAGPEVEALTIEVVDESDDTTRMAVTPPRGVQDVTVPANLLTPGGTVQVVGRARAENGNELLLERYVAVEP